MKIKTQFTGLDLMASRLAGRGGPPQQNRMVKDKRWSLDHATKYSYQAAKIRHTGAADEEQAPALMNPDKVKQNYDDKIVSVGWEYRYKPGDVFDWVYTGTKWIIYLQDLTELAYFRGEVRRCNYKVSWRNKEGQEFTQYLAVRGPVETKINYIQKNGISIDEPNHSLDILLTKTPEALEYFQRYAKFYLQGIEDHNKNTCWRVEATDTISMPGIIEINAVEYYANKDRDDGKIVDALVAKPIDPNTEETNTLISGETFIKPRHEYKYFYRGNETATWTLDRKCPVKMKVSNKQVTLIWDSSYSGQFTLKYGTVEKTIVVKSLF